MKIGDIVKHKLTQEKVIILRIYPESSSNYKQIEVRRSNWEVKQCYEWELEIVVN